MEALITFFRITYLLWPLILLFGVRPLFRKNLPLLERLRIAIQKVFLGWIFMAFSLAVILTQDRQPFLFFARQTNDLLFGGLGLIAGSITIIWTVHRWRSSRISHNKARTLNSLMTLSPGEFEKLVATLFKANGHQAQVLGGSSDHGVDIVVLSADKEKWIVQCKRYSGSVGEPIVRDLYGAMGHEGAQRAYLVTTGSFTTQAQEWAVGKPIVLYDGPALVKLIKSTKLHRSQLRI
jgi:hypothetical protein